MTLSDMDFFSGIMLKCGLHKCTSSCHRLADHSKIPCMAILTEKCANGHEKSWHCHQNAPATCQKCDRDKKEAQKKAQKALNERLMQEKKTKKHLEEIAKLDEEVEQINRKMREKRLDSEQEVILAQKRKDLAAAKERANGKGTPSEQNPLDIRGNLNPKNETVEKSSQHPSGPVKGTPEKSDQHSKLREHIVTAVEHNKSPSKTEWQRQKDQENANNSAIDKIMEMIGLEDVKHQVLKIKAKVETSIRQGTDLKKERLGLTLLGNPGTGLFSMQSFKCHRSNRIKAKQPSLGTTRKC